MPKKAKKQIMDLLISGVGFGLGAGIASQTSNVTIRENLESGITKASSYLPTFGTIARAGMLLGGLNELNKVNKKRR